MREMSPSGVEWIGDIPQEWEIRSLKYLFDFGKGLPITKADLKESGIAVISYGQIHSKGCPLGHPFSEYIDIIYYLV